MIHEIITILESKQWSNATAKNHTISHLQIFEYCKAKNRLKAWNECLMNMSYMFKEDSKNITLPFHLQNDLNRQREIDALDLKSRSEAKLEAEPVKRGRRKAV